MKEFTSLNTNGKAKIFIDSLSLNRNQFINAPVR